MKTSQQEARQVRALEKIASELSGISNMMAMIFARQYPLPTDSSEIPDWAEGVITDGDEVVGFTFKEDK